MSSAPASSVSPSIVEKVPPEIVQLIFEAYHAQKPFPNYTPPPWLVGQICGYWRKIALATPTLWSALRVNTFARYRGNIRLPAVGLELVKPRNEELLRRSQTAPLSVFIALNGSLPSNEAISLLTTVIDHCERWQDLVLICKPMILQQYIGLVRTKLPQLKRLKVKLNCRHRQVMVEEFNAFEDTPMLTIFYDCAPWPSFTRFPWFQLEVYQQGSSHPPFLGDSASLRGSPLLRICGMRTDPDSNISTHLVVHHTLHTLTTGCQEGFEGLTLPALTELNITSLVGLDFLKELESLIRRSGCVLRSLKLSTYEGPTTDDYVSFFQHMPELSHLSLEISHLKDREVIASLHPWAANASATPILANLQSLQLDFTADWTLRRSPEENSYDLDLIFDMIESRDFGSDAMAGLQRVVLNFGRGVSVKVPTQSDRLSMLVEKGLKYVTATN